MTDSAWFRWHPSPTYLAHLFKAVVKQHHRADLPILRKVLPRDGVVFDVGAHAGQYAKLFARHAADGRVFSFEPGSYARSILRVALWANGLRNVIVVPIGLGSRTSVEVLSVPVKRSGSYGFGLSHFGGADGNVRRDLAVTVPLDEMTRVLGVNRLDLIKADIEGWELRMLEGAAESLARFRPMLMLELADELLARAGDSLAAATAFLDRAGYVPVEWTGGGFRQAPGPTEGEWWAPREKLPQLA